MVDVQRAAAHKTVNLKKSLPVLENMITFFCWVAAPCFPGVKK
jgi:hypothetical protein